MNRVVIGLSGGMDSTTLLGIYLELGFEVHCYSFLYGSKHSPYEIKSAREIVKYYQSKGFNLTHSLVDLRQAFSLFQSNLLKRGGDIPEGHYEDIEMKKTVVPGRNLIISSFLAGIAESINAGWIGLGIHAGDRYIYPDCRPEFISSLNSTLYDSTEGKVNILAPFLNYTKADILKWGYSLSVAIPYHLTRTCYKDQPVACGRCGSCRERLEAFEKINKEDPILYEKQ